VSVLEEEIEHSRREYRAELEMIENLHPVKEFTAGVLLAARNWERQTGRTLISLTMEEFLEIFACWKQGGDLES